MRLVPLVALNLLNYALGLTGIPHLVYVLISAICMLPGAIVYIWLGYAGRSAAAGDIAVSRHGLHGLGGLAMITFRLRLFHWFRSKSPSWIGTDELQRRLTAGGSLVILDVRQPNEFTSPPGHLPGAVNVPLAELAGRIPDLVRRDQPIVVVCKTDRRSVRAAADLMAAGLNNVAVLRGGMDGWHRRGLALE
jgi:rhodanese-related sulfurtransferase